MRLEFQKPIQSVLILAIIASMTYAPQAVFAVGSSGFENASYSARSLGQGNAVVARPQDPDTVAFNPAGIPELKGVQVGGNLEGITLHTWGKNAVTHDTEKSASQLVLVPTGYVTANLGERFDNRVGVGLGYNFPFGLSNRYESQSAMARYAGYRNQIKLGALTLATGVKVNEKLNIGGGAVYYRIFQYDQSFNYPNTAVLGFGPDGKIDTYQQGDAWGWVASALFKPIERHNIGVFYRSRANIETSGRVKVDGLVFGQLQGFETTPYWESAIHSDVQLPSNVTVGYAYVPSDKWAVEADLGWTGWSVFADQNIVVDNPNAVTQSLGYIPRNFHNTLSLNVGGHYKLNQKVDLLGGGWIYSAASPKENFDVVIPDSNRYALSGGLTYSLTKRIDITTIGFVQIFEKRSIENREILSKTKTRVDGEYITLNYAFMTGLTYKFGKLEEEPKANIQNAPATASPIIKTFPANKA